MEVIAGLSRIRLILIGFLVISRCTFYLCEQFEAQEVHLDERDRQNVIVLIQQIIHEGGDPVRVLQHELENLQKGKAISRGTLEHLLEPEGGLYIQTKSTDPMKHNGNMFDEDDDNEDLHNHRANLQATASATVGGSQSASIFDVDDDDNIELNVDIDDDDDDDHDHYINPATAATSTGAAAAAQASASAHPQPAAAAAAAAAEAAIDPKTGEQIHQTVIENSPVSASEPKVISVSTSSTSPDGSRQSRSSSYSSSSDHPISSLSADNPQAHLDDEDLLHLDAFAAATAMAGHHADFDEDHHDEEEEEEEDEDHHHHQHFDDNHIWTKNKSEAPSLSIPAAPVASASAAVGPTPGGSAASNTFDSTDDDEHSVQPHNEHFAKTYIDHSDPDDPKEVHVEKKVESVVGPDGASHSHHETKTSTSIGNNPNSFRHHSSSSSYKSSSSSASSSSSKVSGGPKVNHKQRRRSSPKKNRQQQKQASFYNNNKRNAAKHPANFNAHHMPAVPFMPLPPVAVMQYGWPQMYPANAAAAAAAGPLAFQYPFGMGAPAKDLPEFRHFMSKRQAKKLRKAQKQQQAMFAGASAMLF